MPELNFNALLSNGPQSVYQGFVQGQQLQNELAQQKQQRQVADIQLQNALRQQQMEAEEQEAWKTGAGNTQAVLAELQKRGLGKQAMALQKQVSETQAAKLKSQKDQLDLTKSVANQIFVNPQNAVPILQSFYQRTGIDVSDDLAQIQQLGGNPDAIKKWASGIVLEADKLLPKFEKFDQGGNIVTGLVDPLTGQFTQNQAFKKSMAPGEAERIALDRTRVGLDQARLGLEQRRVAVLENKSNTDVPGLQLSKKEVQAREASFPKATVAIKAFEADADELISDLERLKNHPGLSNISGVIGGRTPSITAQGRAAQALYDKIIAKGGFQSLQDIRNASPTGGALGSVSNQEGQQLKAAFSEINREMDPPDIRKAIDRTIAKVAASKSRLREGYDLTYEYRPSVKPASNQTIKFLGFE